MEDFYKDTAKDAETKSDASGNSKEDNRSLPIGKNKKVVIRIKNEPGGKIMTESVILRENMSAYRKIDKKVKDKRCKGIKKCVVSESFTFYDY